MRIFGRYHTLKMKLSPGRVNTFLLFKLPAAYFSGVRVESLTQESCRTRVRYRWINQNPFRSMFWAVQGMAAELSTGMLIMQAVGASGHRYSTLVLKNEGSFYKKARGLIRFNCTEGEKARRAVKQALKTGEPVVCILKSSGVDEEGTVVSEFCFEWSLKLKST